VSDVLRSCERRSDQVASLLSRMISIPSRTGDEGKLVEFTAEQMDELGLSVEIDPFGNVIGRTDCQGPEVVFDAHLDTVGTGEATAWSFDPYCGDIRDGSVLGRGSVDQKGGMAAMLMAARTAKDSGAWDGLNVTLVGSVHEEDADGLCWDYRIRECGHRPAIVVLTEPTNLSLARGQRGRMELRVEIRGVSAHGSAPERGVSAATLASRLCLDITDMSDRLEPDVEGFLGAGSATVSLVDAHGPSLCAVADTGIIHVDRRTTPAEDEDACREQIETLPSFDEKRMTVLVPDGNITTHKGLEYPYRGVYPGWLLPLEHPAVVAGIRTHVRVFDTKPTVGRWVFSTNGVAICGRAGIPCIGFGPGDESLAHAPDERVPVEHLVKAAAFYVAFPRMFGGSE
jgi:putative selenium metabolism hydrolase